MKHLLRTAWTNLVLAALCGLLPSARAASLVMAVSEGSSGGTDHARVIAKYKGLADAIGRSINASVNVVFIREFAALEEGLKQQRFDLAMARPSDYPARALRDHGYQFVATSKPEGHCLIVVPKASPLTSIRDIRGQRVVLPNPAAYMTRLCTAELRDQGVDMTKENIVRVKEQDAIPFYLSNRFGDVGGVASYSGVARGLEKSGLRVLHQSRPQPYFPLVAKRTFTAAQMQAIRRALATLPDTTDGQAVLKSVGTQGFDTGTEQRLRDLLEWLER
ncbi:phosphate/phosphite/phosphonate ABC transporter substrate-binding protein [Hydrogenophaga sp.]|uniref:phosphate/phosphite/phosphonate ABC transporter substrate-binding protein n=1 Tax=Hydrogenophaga sp. TaxID=1904254 RepID=UPI00286DFDD1|nr:PhnD/SsuA/transferrin family substrate-binding protein [Hydrogenophaga sp.]